MTPLCAAVLENHTKCAEVLIKNVRLFYYLLKKNLQYIIYILDYIFITIYKFKFHFSFFLTWVNYYHITYLHSFSFILL
jgi:hypothetical protein